MKLFPIAERELRVASRRAGTYWTRLLGAGLGILSVAFIFWTAWNARAVEQSRMLFITLSVIAFAYCLLSGVITTSDCVSEERRDGTLGLLFLTNLRGYDVVVGKLVASSMRAVSAVVALMPVMALPLLMGGVPAQVVGMVALVVVNTLFVSLVVGVMVSVVARDARQAIGGTIGVLLLWVVLLPLGRELWLEYVVRGRFTGTPAELRELFQGILQMNPVHLLYRALERVVMGGAGWRDVWIGLGMQHLLGWGLLILACVVLPRSWRDRVETRARTVMKEGPGGGEQRRFRGGVLDWHPFAWMVVRERRSAWTTWLGLAVIAGVWVWGYWEVKEEWLAGVVGLWTTFAAGLWLKLRVAALACRHLHEHRRTGALELVLSTPLTPEALLRGNLLGIRYLVLPALAAVLAGAALLLAASLGQEQAWSDRTEVPLTFAVGGAMLVMDLLTLAWSGMWRGLASARYVRAYVTTVAMVLVLPWVLFGTSVIAVGVMAETLPLNVNADSSYPTLLLWWAGISLGVNLWQWTRSRAGLVGRLRELAAEPYGTVRAGRKPL